MYFLRLHCKMLVPIKICKMPQVTKKSNQVQILFIVQYVIKNRLDKPTQSADRFESGYTTVTCHLP